MATPNVVTLNPTRKSPRKPARASAEPRPSSTRRKLATVSAAAIGAVAVSATGLSLSDLADSIVEVAHVSAIKAYALSIAIDANFVSTEAFSLFCSAAVARETRWAVTSTKVVTLMMSGIANAYAMAHQAETLVMQGACVAAGFAIPALVAMATSTLGKAVRG